MIESLQMTREVKVGNFTIGGNKRFALIAGPCAGDIKFEEYKYFSSLKAYEESLKTATDSKEITYGKSWKFYNRGK